MQHVEHLTQGRLKIGAGTLYGTLSKMEADGLIQPLNEFDRRKTYTQTLLGDELLKIEVDRLQEQLNHGRQEMGGNHE